MDSFQVEDWVYQALWLMVAKATEQGVIVDVNILLALCQD